MLKKKMKKFFAFAMALVMTMSVMLSCLSVSAFAVTQSEIDALKSQKSQLASQKNSLQSTINSLQGQQNDQIALKNALDEKNAITVKQILNLNEQIELHTQLIEQKTKEVDEAQKVADAQLEKYKVRVRAMEESGRYNYFEVLFGASSIGEFLSLIDDIGDIMRSDKELEDAYRQSVADLKAVKAEYEQAKAEMEDSKTELETLKAQQEKDIAEAASVIASAGRYKLQLLSAQPAFRAGKAAQCRYSEEGRRAQQAAGSQQGKQRQRQHRRHRKSCMAELLHLHNEPSGSAHAPHNRRI